MIQKIVTGKLEQINIGSNSNLLCVKNTENKLLEFVDYNKFPLTHGDSYNFTYFESGGSLNVVSIADLKGQKILIDRQVLIDKILNLTTSLQFKLKQLKEVL